MSKMMLPIELTKILYASWEGEIAVSSQDSEIYGKCLNGPGKVTFKNGNRYEGTFHNGLLSEKGVFTWANGIVYEGDFTDNRITGRGVYRWPDGSLYEGETKDGLRHGIGKYTLEDAVYEGGWKEGKKNGHGKIAFKSGSIFEGTFVDDFKDGFGKMYYYPSGNFFEGEWRKDVKHGSGTMNWTDIREKYVGEWRNNLQQGWGIHIWLESKGEGKFMRNRYQGNWAGGVRDGFGIFHYANGSKYQGFWKENKKQGFALFTNQNGHTSLTLFSKDRMVKQSKLTAQSGPDQLKKLRKEVEPNYYLQCLQIETFYYPFVPNLQQLYNYLLRNNTYLKSWYKGASLFYDQQSEYSFCLNFEGTWKMIRSLKILGDFSLATFNRGLNGVNPDIEALLNSITPQSSDNVSYQGLYYAAKATKNINAPFREYIVHDRERNILFREFVHLLVWMSFCLDPNVDKPHKSIEKLITKISPFLESISKNVKTIASENMSENRSSISKADKNISPFYRGVNTDLFLNALFDQGQSLFRNDRVLKVKDFIAIGRVDAFFGEAEYVLMEKVFEKYFDSELLLRERPSNYSNSSLPTKLLNVLNYELIEYEFIEMVYILLVKKLPSTKENQENKKKYGEVALEFKRCRGVIEKERLAMKEFVDQGRVAVSQKDRMKREMQKRRELMEIEKNKREELKKERERESREIATMGREDMDIKDGDFDEEQSEFEI